MKVNCLSCGFAVDLDDDSYSDYEGQIRCYTCGALLDVKAEEGKLKKVAVARAGKRTGREGV